MPLAFHEEAICEAIVRHFESREGVGRQDVRSPEDEAHAHPVEMIWKLKEQLYALEHTGIEPFEGLVRLSAEAQFRTEPIVERVKGKLPEDVFELILPLQALQEFKGADLDWVQAALVDWILDTGPKLPRRSYADRLKGSGPTKLGGLPFNVELFRFESITGEGRLQIVHQQSGDRDAERVKRIQRACDKKFPKLAGWKKSDGARTILVLENNDFQLTNPVVVAEAYLGVALNRDDRPDETYLVDTCFDDWYGWPLLIDRLTYFDLAKQETKPWKIDH